MTNPICPIMSHPMTTETEEGDYGTCIHRNDVQWVDCQGSMCALWSSLASNDAPTHRGRCAISAETEFFADPAYKLEED